MNIIKHVKIMTAEVIFSTLLLLTTIPFLGILWIAKKYIDCINLLTDKTFNDERKRTLAKNCRKKS